MSRVLLVLLDGTAYHEKGQNVSAIGALFRHCEQSATQKVYYDRGVGTGFFRLTGSAFGFGLPRNVRQAYKWLVKNYLPGSRVVWVGWSRGAFTGRLLGGMIEHSGLANRPEDTLPAWIAYRTHKSPPAGRKIDMELGLALDTVAALRGPYRFRDVFAPTNLKRGLHFVAIDEQRPQFEHTPWAGAQTQTVCFIGTHAVAGAAVPGGLSDIVTAEIAKALKETGVKISAEFTNDLLPNCEGPIPKPAFFWKMFGKRPRKFCPTATPHPTVFQRIDYPGQKMFK